MGGFWADSAKAAKKMYGSAVSELWVTSAGMKRTTVATAAKAGT
jgi:hypothetical protein